MSDLLKFSCFNALVTQVCLQSPLQKKAILSSLEQQNNVFFHRAESACRLLVDVAHEEGLDTSYITNAYLAMCKEMLSQQVAFSRSGSYMCPDFATAYRNVYSSKTKMTSYMFGLALSQFLWPNHYRMYDFFISQAESLLDVCSLLEIGPGHGLYLLEAAKLFPDASLTAIDISEISIQMCKSLLMHAGVASCDFRVGELDTLGNRRFDLVVMGEVLEHIDHPYDLLCSIHRLLADDGILFLTTCANCPAIDHVFLFRNLAHIHDYFRRANFSVVRELPLPIPNATPAGANAALNYAALLQKATQ